MQKKKVQVKKRLKKGSRRIEAWIYAVINPLIEALKTEKSFLKEHNWTWRYHIKDLEFIKPLEGYMDSIALPALEDFLLANPRIERERKKHDDLRTALLKNCQIAFENLLTLNAFQQRVTSSLSDYRQKEPQKGYPGGAVPEEDFNKLIAQYVINNIKTLPEHYSSSNFWHKFANEFLAFRKGKIIEQLDASGKQLEEEDERFLRFLKNMRSILCEKYDLPPISSSYYEWGRTER